MNGDEPERDLGRGKIVFKKTTKNISVSIEPEYTKDYEIIPCAPFPDSFGKTNNDKVINDFLQRYVTPIHERNFLLDNVIGVELNFNKEFYVPEEIGSVEDILAEIRELDKNLKLSSEDIKLGESSKFISQAYFNRSNISHFPAGCSLMVGIGASVGKVGITDKDCYSNVNLNQVNYVVMEDGEVQNRVRENDLIFLMSSEDYESIAKCAVVLGETGEVYLNSFCRGLLFEDTNVYAPFVNYQLLSEKFRDSLRFEARGFTRINIKVDRISSQFVVLPPFEEQQAIASYLDDKYAKIDATVANIEKQIDAMKRLKRALINEVVTGKREV